MILWHVAGSVFLFRWIFRDPDADLRFVALGGLLSDLIDKPIGLILFPGTFGTARVFAHSLGFAVALMTVGMLATSRGTTARHKIITLSVGVLFHLLLDGMWAMPETLFWPLFGTEFSRFVGNYWGGFLGRIFSSPLTIVQEVAGFVYLLSMWVGAGLSRPSARRRLYTEGRIVIEEPVE